MSIELSFNDAAFREFRTSAEAVALVRAEAEAVARAAGPGFGVTEANLRQDRSRFFVHPVTPEAFRANYYNLAVLRGLQRRAQ